MSSIAAARPTTAPATRRLVQNGRITIATARSNILQMAADPILLLRSPLSPLLMLVAYSIVYSISSQTAVADGNVLGFLVMGLLATGAWSATVWGSGNAMQSEIFRGTISAVVAAPGSTVAVILGHGIGSIIWGLPAIATCLGLGLFLGAEFTVDSPLSAIVALAVIYISTLCIGLAFGGIFMLSRNSNALSNFLQSPIFLLGGFFVPRTVLPEWMQWISNAIPLAHALDALRATTLAGATLADVRLQLLLALSTSAIFLIVGAWALGRVDYELRRRGTLDII